MSGVCAWLLLSMACTVGATVRADSLTGVWRFQKEINATLNGEPVDIPGPAYDGLLIYTADGHVSVNLMPKDRSWRVDSATLSELRQTVGEGSSTGAAAGTVTHIPSVSLDPADAGCRLVRRYVLEGDTLKLCWEMDLPRQAAGIHDDLEP